ncbi:protein of unknown function [Granulicatella balaenopterae]|uniref:Uncharacterized protein n=1 Tax=Granulicatella balaenopterae TaxID=137733 RepID=A0A1H9NJ41_9LACT|nr:GIY-YIG nuclease family protein [Granulicatella balaenopterae]SER35911.1 protein of unknown function [Granulicatella balaenopterae]
MEKRAKNIHLFLMDGESTGRIKCTLANWTGISYKIPRTMLDKAKDIVPLSQTGVYFLFGHSDDTDEPVVYIGQAGVRKNGNGILGRLFEHKNNEKKDYWTEAVVFTTANDSFGQTEISYLENRFCMMAKESNRYEVKNEIEPTRGNITEEKESELEEFIDYSKLIMGALGYKVFEPIVKVKLIEPEVPVDEEPILYFRSKKVDARGQRTADGFAVFAGSKISPVISKACPVSTIKNREKYQKYINEDGLLIKDINFTSPSAAAGFCGGSSLSGNANWKDENGVSLGNLERESM